MVGLTLFLIRVFLVETFSLTTLLSEVFTNGFFCNMSHST